MSYILQFLFLFPTLFIWQYFFISDSFINTDTILAIFQTNIGEAKSYIYDFIGIKQIIGLNILLIISFFILRFNNKLVLNNTKNRKFLLVILIISVCLNIFLMYRYKYNIVAQILTDTTNKLKEYEKFKEQVAERKIRDIKIDEKENINKGVYVLVIGESQNKEHMSAYRYNKKQHHGWIPWKMKKILLNLKTYIHTIHIPCRF
ncbi:hypothetical protein [Candidatus Ruminimicrobium bovinum]|uniref:hypothetical protein n=1 Tax=Candidatus Ruminimicrobium bovinum TaxID=3242779 RepID=UPI0039B8AEF0